MKHEFINIEEYLSKNKEDLFIIIIYEERDRKTWYRGTPAPLRSDIDIRPISKHDLKKEYQDVFNKINSLHLTDGTMWDIKILPIPNL